MNEQNSLLAEDYRRPITRQLPRGNDAHSAFEALFVYDNQGTWEEYQFDQGDELDILLFTNDFPIQMDVQSFYSGFDLPHSAVFKDYEELSFVSQGDLSDAAVIVPDKASTGLYEQITGETPTNGVLVKGYDVYGQVLDRGIQTDPNPETCTLRMICKAASGVCHGPCHYACDHIAAPENTVPIIIDESDYTQDMADADNSFTDGPTRYIVVGLFALIVRL